jgi:hypothetical protein
MSKPVLYFIFQKGGYINSGRNYIFAMKNNLPSIKATKNIGFTKIESGFKLFVQK